MNLDIKPEKLEAAIIAEAVDQILGADQGEAYSRYLTGIRAGVESRIDKMFADHADALIQEALDAAIKDGFEREYSKVDQWGKREGEKTSISKELARLVSGYWSERVDSSGKPTSSTYGNTLTRAEYLMTVICSSDFSESMKASALNVTGHLKDGLRAHMAAQMDTVLDGLFKVKSLQDQGKVEKPY